jgi:hydroxyacylglutathione hydrolase
MQVIQVYMNNSLRNYNYIIYSEKNKEAIFIDPLDLNITIPKAIEIGLNPKYLINTHHHHDHIKDNKLFLDGDESRLYLELDDGEEFYLSESEKIKAIGTPGHVAEHMCYLLLEDERQVGFISGDAVFNAGIGNTKNGGDLNELYESTMKINALLDDSVPLYPSHDYFLTNLKFALSIEKDNSEVLKFLKIREVQNQNRTFINTTIKDERRINPFFRLKELKRQEEFQSLSEKEIFLEIRKRRDKY